MEKYARSVNIRKGTMVWPLLDGGVQEANKRAGTENLVGIIGMGVAADLARRQMDERLSHLLKLKTKLLEEMPNYIDEYIINTPIEHSLPNRSP